MQERLPGRQAHRPPGRPLRTIAGHLAPEFARVHALARLHQAKQQRQAQRHGRHRLHHGIIEHHAAPAHGQVKADREAVETAGEFQLQHDATDRRAPHAGQQRDAASAAAYYRAALKRDPNNGELLDRAFLSLLVDGDIAGKATGGYDRRRRPYPLALPQSACFRRNAGMSRNDSPVASPRKSSPTAR